MIRCLRIHSRLRMFAFLLLLTPFGVLANDTGAFVSGSLHGDPVAVINDHGQLVMILDEFDAELHGGDGVADYVFVFAPDGEKAVEQLGQLVESLNGHDGRVNLEMVNVEDRTTLRVHIPRTLNAWLTVRKNAPMGDQRQDSAETKIRGQGGGDERVVLGLAMNVVNVAGDNMTLEDAVSEYLAFNLVPDPEEARAASNCAAGGYCSSACSITVGTLSCSVTCHMGYYACCTYNGCSCLDKGPDWDPE